MNLQESQLPRITKASKRFWIWLIPIIAILAGAGLLWEHYLERGVLVHVRFDTAEGLVAGKTELRYKDIVVGTLENLTLDDDLNHVTAHIRIKRSMESHIKEGTRFWVIRPRVDKQGVSGLTTILSGAFITLEPPKEPPKDSVKAKPKPADHFVGLESPPLTSAETPGVRIVLVTDSGGVGIGTSIYYKKIHVGTVEAMRFSTDHQVIMLDTFIQAPYDKLVTTASRFWRSSGINFQMNSEGFQLQTEALESIVTGSISFDSPNPDAPSVEPKNHLPANPDASGEEPFHLPLFPSFAEIESSAFKLGKHFVLYFDGSVRGLSKGASVDYRGVQIGEVLDVRLDYDKDTDVILIPVTVSILTSRLTGSSHRNPDLYFTNLIRQGLKAHLEIGNFLTSQLFVSLQMDTNKPVEEIIYTKTKIPIIPTSQRPIMQLADKVLDILGKIQELPFDKMGDDFTRTLKSTREMVEKLRSFPDSLNHLMANSEALIGNLDKTLGLLNKTMEGMQPGNPNYMELRKTARELSEAAKAIRQLAESLEERPDTLIFGK